MPSKNPHKDLANKFYASISVLQYGAMDNVNEEILSRMAACIRPVCDEDLDHHGEIIDYSEPAMVQDRLLEGFSQRRVPEVFMELLEEFEHYEILQWFKDLFYE